MSSTTISLFCDRVLQKSLFSILLLGKKKDHAGENFTLTPLPFGKEIHGFSLPMTNTLLSRVANELSIASFMCTMLKPPSCRSRCVITPTRPILRPPVAMAMTAVSKWMNSVIFPVERSILTVSLTLIAGSGYRILWIHQSPVSRYSPECHQNLVQRLNQCSKRTFAHHA